MDQSVRDIARWIGGFQWDWWCTPTFRYPKSQAQAASAVEQWLATMPNAYAIVAFERGEMGGRLHCHALIGGVGREALQRTHLLASWRRGIITIDRFDPRRGAILYMLKRADEPEGLELIGNPQPYHPRRRRRR